MKIARIRFFVFKLLPAQLLKELVNISAGLSVVREEANLCFIFRE